MGSWRPPGRDRLRAPLGSSGSGRSLLVSGLLGVLALVAGGCAAEAWSQLPAGLASPVEYGRVLSTDFDGLCEEGPAGASAIEELQHLAVRWRRLEAPELARLAGAGPGPSYGDDVDVGYFEVEQRWWGSVVAIEDVRLVEPTGGAWLGPWASTDRFVRLSTLFELPPLPMAPPGPAWAGAPSWRPSSGLSGLVEGFGRFLVGAALLPVVVLSATVAGLGQSGEPIRLPALVSGQGDDGPAPRDVALLDDAAWHAESDARLAAFLASLEGLAATGAPALARLDDALGRSPCSARAVCTSWYVTSLPPGATARLSLTLTYTTPSGCQLRRTLEANPPLPGRDAFYRPGEVPVPLRPRAGTTRAVTSSDLVPADPAVRRDLGQGAARTRAWLARSEGARPGWARRTTLPFVDEATRATLASAAAPSEGDLSGPLLCRIRVPGSYDVIDVADLQLEVRHGWLDTVAWRGAHVLSRDVHHADFILPHVDLLAGERMKVTAYDTDLGNDDFIGVAFGTYTGQGPLVASGEALDVTCEPRPAATLGALAEGRRTALLAGTEAMAAAPVDLEAADLGLPAGKARAARDTVEEVAALVGWDHPTTRASLAALEDATATRQRRVALAVRQAIATGTTEAPLFGRTARLRRGACTQGRGTRLERCPLFLDVDPGLTEDELARLDVDILVGDADRLEVRVPHLPPADPGAPPGRLTRVPLRAAHAVVDEGAGGALLRIRVAASRGPGSPAPSGAPAATVLLLAVPPP